MDWITDVRGRQRYWQRCQQRAVLMSHSVRVIMLFGIAFIVMVWLIWTGGF